MGQGVTGQRQEWVQVCFVPVYGARRGDPDRPPVDKTCNEPIRPARAHLLPLGQMWSRGAIGVSRGLLHLASTHSRRNPSPLSARCSRGRGIPDSVDVGVALRGKGLGTGAHRVEAWRASITRGWRNAYQSPASSAREARLLDENGRLYYTAIRNWILHTA